MNLHELTINAVELASELADYELQKKWQDSIVIWEECDGGAKYTEEAQDIFNELYDKYYSLIESTKVN